MDQFSAHAVGRWLAVRSHPGRNRLEGHLCVVGGECSALATSVTLHGEEHSHSCLSISCTTSLPNAALAAGASGIVGSGICRQLLMEGARVAALLRREDQKDGLLKECQGALAGYTAGAMGRRVPARMLPANAGCVIPTSSLRPAPAGAPLQNLFIYVVADMSKEEQCECMAAAALKPWPGCCAGLPRRLA